ncbi:MAG: hypothetical protein AB1805_09225 [Nitrospirota bacterium]
MDKRLVKRAPERHQKAWILGSIGLMIGAGIGGYFSAITGSSTYIVIGTFIGGIVGDLIGFLLNKRISLKALLSIEKIANNVLIFVSFSFVAGGMMVFIQKGRWIGLIGAVVFGLCGLYLYKKRS